VLICRTKAEVRDRCSAGASLVSEVGSGTTSDVDIEGRERKARCNHGWSAPMPEVSASGGR